MAYTVLGMLIVLAVLIGIGVLSGRKVQDSGDFLTGGGKASSFLVCGAIMGSLVSSQATIGTAQLAFHYGLAAWWFTLGSGIGCLILALGYVRPLRRSGCVTELQIISREYGAGAGSLSSVLNAVGIFISVLAQVVACTGLITILLPQIPMAIVVLLTIAIMCIYVIFGGTWGASIGGAVKLLLLYGAAILCMAYVLIAAGGFQGLYDQLVRLLAGTDLGMNQELAGGLNNLETTQDVSQRFFSLVARGAAKDIGSGISLLLGVLSTQTYAQAVWSAQSDRKARRGALLSACLIPPIGVAGICIGLFMRTHYLTQIEVDVLTSLGANVPDLPVLASTIQVFPSFVLNHLPPLIAGIILGTLFLTVIGGGAGLSLGMATIMLKDIYKRVTNRINSPAKELAVVRVTIGVILLAAGVIAIAVPESTINDLGFLSMGLRGAVVFLPLSCALWLKGRIAPVCILVSIVLAPVAVLVGNWMILPFDALFLGMLVSLACCVAGWVLGRNAGRSRRI